MVKLLKKKKKKPEFLHVARLWQPLSGALPKRSISKCQSPEEGSLTGKQVVNTAELPFHGITVNIPVH